MLRHSDSAREKLNIIDVSFLEISSFENDSMGHF